MIIKKLFNWFLSFFKSKKEKESELLKITFVSELPEFPKEKTLYIEGDKEVNDFWYALMKCPCGCNENIMLNLMSDVRPCWELQEEMVGFSLYPSVWRTKNCKSHFWVRKNKVIWAD